MFWIVVVPAVALALWSVFGQTLQVLRGKGCSGNCGSCANCPWAMTAFNNDSSNRGDGNDTE